MNIVPRKVVQEGCSSDLDNRHPNAHTCLSRLTATAASIASTSIASASVPSAALVLMMIVLTAIEAPVADVFLLWAIDWFV